MAGIRQSIETNKKILLLVATLLVVIITLLFKFYGEQKRENRALRLKILSMSENRRAPKTWSALLTRPKTIAATAPQQASGTATTAAVNVDQSLATQDTQVLAVQLDDQMSSVKNADLKTLENNIAIADEIISREPDSYGAYKAKLISLLTKEGKFNQAADESEVEGLLESMAQFNIGNDRRARREAALISETNEQRNALDSQLDEIANSKESLETMLNNLDASSPQYNILQDQIADLERKESEYNLAYEEIENKLASNSAQIANEDIIEIPFMRMLAQNDLEGVADNAQSFIEQFPNSPSGYFYLMRSLELQGQKDQALQVLQNSTLPPDARQNLLQRLESQGASDPKNYWQQLSF